MKRILLVEDDETLAMGIEYALREDESEVSLFSNHEAAASEIENMSKGDASYDLCLFDVMLPDGNGFDLLKKVRDAELDLPVIMLSAVSDEGNVTCGLDSGAYDYITKPFRVRELISRIHAVLRRYEKANARLSGFQQTREVSAQFISTKRYDGKVYYDEIIMDTDRMEAIMDGANIHLSYSEYKVLLYLIQNQGKPLTRERLLDRLFSNESRFIDDNTLSVYMNRLRQKIGDNRRETPYIETIRGIGYRMRKL